MWGSSHVYGSASTSIKLCANVIILPAEWGSSLPGKWRSRNILQLILLTNARVWLPLPGVCPSLGNRVFHRVIRLFIFCVPVKYKVLSWALASTIPGLVELSHVWETEDKQVNTQIYNSELWCAVKGTARAVVENSGTWAGGGCPLRALLGCGSLSRKEPWDITSLASHPCL